MRQSQAPLTLLSLLLVALPQTNIVHAGPYPRDNLHDVGYSFLQHRDCYLYCGTDNQYCCAQGQGCYTNAQNIAYCSTAAAGQAFAAGGYQVYTTLITQTDLVVLTSTYSVWDGAAATTTSWTPSETGLAVCDPGLAEISCGAVCCKSSQKCLYLGKCQDLTTGATPNPTTTTTTGRVATGSVTYTTTQSFLAPSAATGTSLPVTVSTSSGGLSGGAIAGIVIGVIFGIILLLLLCFCCLVRAGFDGLLALFGLGPRKRRSTERVEVIEERYSRHGSGSVSRRETHGGWFGAAARPTRVTETRKKKSSGFGGLGAVGAGLLGLAVVLGLKRSHDKKEKRERSDISSSYYTDSYTGTSLSSESSDRRTRQSRISRPKSSRRR